MLVSATTIRPATASRVVSVRWVGTSEAHACISRVIELCQVTTATHAASPTDGIDGFRAGVEPANEFKLLSVVRAVRSVLVLNVHVALVSRLDDCDGIALSNKVSFCIWIVSVGSALSYPEAVRKIIVSVGVGTIDHVVLPVSSKVHEYSISDLVIDVSLLILLL